eukprot:11104464-Heterocapsa_arctica.AAC.1
MVVFPTHTCWWTTKPSLVVSLTHSPACVVLLLGWAVMYSHRRHAGLRWTTSFASSMIFEISSAARCTLIFWDMPNASLVLRAAAAARQSARHSSSATRRRLSSAWACWSRTAGR